MKISNFPYYLTFVFLCMSLTKANGQSKFEFGIGIGINHSSLEDDIRTPNGKLESNFRGLRMLALSTRIGYKFNNRFHLNGGLGLSWIGSQQRDLKARRIASTLEVPLQIEYNLSKHFQIRSGLIYNYVFSYAYETETDEIDIQDSLHGRHQVGIRNGIALSYELVELFLNYDHYFTDLSRMILTDVNGDPFGTYSNRIHNIQFGIMIRQ